MKSKERHGIRLYVLHSEKIHGMIRSLIHCYTPPADTENDREQKRFSGLPER